MGIGDNVEEKSLVSISVSVKPASGKESSLVVVETVDAMNNPFRNQ